MHLSFYELINRSRVFAETIVTAYSALSWLFTDDRRLSAENWPETSWKSYSHANKAPYVQRATQWTLANNSSQYPPQFGTSSLQGHCRAEGWKGDLITLPTARKSNARDKELITLYEFLWNRMTNRDSWFVRKIYALPLASAFVVNSGNEHSFTILNNLSDFHGSNTVLSRFLSLLKMHACSFTLFYFQLY